MTHANNATVCRDSAARLSLLTGHSSVHQIYEVVVSIGVISIVVNAPCIRQISVRMLMCKNAFTCTEQPSLKRPSRINKVDICICLLNQLYTDDRKGSTMTKMGEYMMQSSKEAAE